MKNLIKRIVQTMVDNPEEVEVLEVKGEQILIMLRNALKREKFKSPLIQDQVTLSYIDFDKEKMQAINDLQFKIRK